MENSPGARVEVETGMVARKRRPKTMEGLRPSLRQALRDYLAGTQPDGYEVVARDGFKAVFLERPSAERYAAACHGTLDPMWSGKTLRGIATGP